jgi:hypothetical protein
VLHRTNWTHDEIKELSWNERLMENIREGVGEQIHAVAVDNQSMFMNEKVDVIQPIRLQERPLSQDMFHTCTTSKRLLDSPQGTGKSLNLWTIQVLPQSDENLHIKDKIGNFKNDRSVDDIVASKKIMCLRYQAVDIGDSNNDDVEEDLLALGS